MNTVAWMVDGDRDTFVLALHGDVALLVKGERPGEVWQFRRRGGQQEAIDRIVHETALIEHNGGDVREPVEFDLSPEAEWQICRSTEFQNWFDAPNLREELMAAVEDRGMLISWTPTAADWVTVGYVEKGVTFTATPPEDWAPVDWVSVGYVEKGVTVTSTAPLDPAVGDVWIKP